MIWKRCRKCGILFKGLVCPNCSSKFEIYESPIELKKELGDEND